MEDDADDRYIFQRYASEIAAFDVCVTTAATTEEADEALRSHDFGFIFLDLNLGGSRSGLDWLASAQKDGLKTPVVVVTGTGDEKKAVEAMKCGAYDYIVKADLSSKLLQRTLQETMRQLSQEKEEARAAEELVEMSLSDELTGLPNRRLLSERMTEEVARAERTGRPFAVLMMDLDHFKQVNDRYGHQVGDEALKRCAGAIRNALRTVDFVARFGGEEFCAILIELHKQEAAECAERLRRAVKQLPKPAPTLSIGVALWQEGLGHKQLIARADKALYEAKAQGRDRVVLYGEQ